jgi:cytochrome d ubiquinol oxidase subunit II
MMETIWYAVLSLMLATYVVLDGFDFGAGILHLFVAKTDAERRTVLNAIGPVWDGNEVWLLAGGGILVFAFPAAYAAGFSGFYLPLMMALWLLIMRGLAIELRSREENRLWHSLWDGAFAFSSILMAVILGAALGNVIRGVPLDATHYFAGPLFSNFLPGRNPGVLDWYTVLIGVFTLLALGGHGALYLAWKTEGPVHARSLACARMLWIAIIGLGILATAATAVVQPRLFPSLAGRVWSWPLVALILGGLFSVFRFLRPGTELKAFLGSVTFLAGMLAATAAAMYPFLLFSTLDPAWDLSIHNAAAGGLALQVGLVWWIPAVLIAIGYFIYLFRSFRGKVGAEGHGH